jgi:hypothetical protein
MNRKKNHVSRSTIQLITVIKFQVKHKYRSGSVFYHAVQRKITLRTL